MAAARVERRLAAILAADVVGYSRLMERDEAGTFARLKTLRCELVEPILARHGGRFVDLKGDGAIVEFQSAVEAVEAAVEIQQAIAEWDTGVPESQRIRYRIGINLGDVIVDGDSIYGDGVNIAARIESLCEPGGVWLARNVRNQVRGKLALDFVPTGRHQVKNISEPVETFRITIGGARPALGASRLASLGSQLRRSLLPAAGAMATIVFSAGIWQLWPGDPPSVGQPGVAVLPFDAFGGDEATMRLADGMTEDVITDLSRFRDLDVIARNSTAAYKGKAVDVRQVGRELNVSYVLEGSVQRNDENVRITAQLIDASSGRHVWSERWDRPATDVFAVQAEIADTAAARIGGYGIIQQADRARARRKLPGSLSAYDLTLFAIEAKQKGTQQQAEEALRLATRAIETDPSYARAWIIRAWTHGTLAMVTGDYATAQPRMEADARHALTLDPNDAEAHAALAEAFGYAGRLVDAHAEHERALALNPSSADMRALFAGWSGNYGDAVRGARHIDEAVRLNPSFPPWYRNIMREAYFFSGRFRDSIRAMLGRENGPSQVPDWMLLAASYGHLGESTKAQAAAAELSKLVPNFSAELGFNFGYIFNRTQERDLLVAGLRMAGLRVCGTDAELAPYPGALRLPECVTS
jgi:TolB-like protein/class 3 adenylate cyclase